MGFRRIILSNAYRMVCHGVNGYFISVVGYFMIAIFVLEDDFFFGRRRLIPWRRFLSPRLLGIITAVVCRLDRGRLRCGRRGCCCYCRRRRLWRRRRLLLRMMGSSFKLFNDFQKLSFAASSNARHHRLKKLQNRQKTQSLFPFFPFCYAR